MADGDGILDDEEFELGTDPLDADTDGDGWSVADELFSSGTDPTGDDSHPGSEQREASPRCR
jgi:hypothetical protein